MKTYGLKATQELISIVLDEEGNPRLDTLKKPGDGDDWVAPEIIPLVKLPKPEVDVLTQYVEPKLVWYEDRVERDWEIKEIPPGDPEEIAEQEARKAAKLALIEKTKILFAPYVVDPEGFSLATQENDQNAFTRLLTLLNTAGAPNEMETSIADINNVVHNITVGRFKQIMVVYGLEIHNRWIAFRS
jgi:hypothetical protein